MARRYVLRLAVLLPLSLAFAGPALAKDHGYRSPGGRRVYEPGERFGELVAQDTRHAVVEVVTGLAPEGNLGASLGWLAPQLGGFELYAGLGLQTNPSRQYALSARYWPPLGSFKPYLGVGFVYQELYAIGSANRALFYELGHKWRLHHTHHFTLSLGLRHILGIDVDGDSVLRGADTDPTLLREQLDEVGSFVPTLALRFSRSF